MDLDLDQVVSVAPAPGSAGHRRVVPARALISRLAYPLLMAGTVAVGVTSFHRGWDPGTVTPLFMMGTMAYLAVMERLIPYERAWHPTRGEWGLYAVYLVLTLLGGAIAQVMVVTVVLAVAPPTSAAPLWIELPAVILLGSLVQYPIHRVSHTNRWLWRLHGVHHVPDKVNLGNHSVNHIFDILFKEGVAQLVMAYLGFSELSLFCAQLFVMAQGYFVHANVDVHLGWLSNLLVSPEHHRLHHSVDVREAGHYSSDLSIWDRLFGTYTWTEGRAPEVVGLQDPGSFPGTGRVVATVLHPFRLSRHPI